MSESTVLGLAVHNLSPDPLGSGEAIGDQALPERETITLNPCKGFPRRLNIEWDRHGATIVLITSRFKTLAWTYAKHAEISLVAQQLTFEPRTIYNLYAGEACFRLSVREFQALRAKLEPRGVRVWKP